MVLQFRKRDKMNKIIILLSTLLFINGCDILDFLNIEERVYSNEFYIEDSNNSIDKNNTFDNNSTENEYIVDNNESNTTSNNKENNNSIKDSNKTMINNSNNSTKNHTFLHN